MPAASHHSRMYTADHNAAGGCGVNCERIDSSACGHCVALAAVRLDVDVTDVTRRSTGLALHMHRPHAVVHLRFNALGVRDSRPFDATAKSAEPSLGVIIIFAFLFSGVFLFSGNRQDVAGGPRP